MTENRPRSPLPQLSDADDSYDSNNGDPKNSPLPNKLIIDYEPTQSPPPDVPLPSTSRDSSSEPEHSKRSPPSQCRSRQSDAVLEKYMAEGRHVNTAPDAEEEKSVAGDEMRAPVDGTDPELQDLRHVVGKSTRNTSASYGDKDAFDLKALTSLASGAMGALESLKHTMKSASKQGNLDTPKDDDSSKPDAPSHQGEMTESVKPAIPELAPTTGPEALPPIRECSPQSTFTNGQGVSSITLPSLSAQLGDINHLPELSNGADSNFAHSPPSRAPRRFAAVPGHGSSPKSPTDLFRPELPSPSRGGGGNFYFSTNSHRKSSQTETSQYTNAADHSSSNPETSSTDHPGSTLTTMSGIDRMSINGITNPEVGGYSCTYQGCTAQPFQTQYLLKSHANVHSSNRPHYCGVKGCPRSEGGKGFKRKNEMIRHGLVHASPGYVCPFCPEREHKYPRPDNLQRHVRAQHSDKNKDDPQLRDVLSQRPEGPSRGRRRRGGATS